ncbi:hypothetical protein SAMN04487895_1318 [Paenibacillus sophorae]|uniref:DUF2255 family protein n=1 Tax=Paenibacillus sophorae TaxID=1333845 RepID=A0A1H8W222_9BACL|nr:DUF2255 family protein [Paenibacillus sophorae]SEP21675.1 hypothetical protein SAMN04487895_1318 [Paenibacillus sophorae]
MVPSRGAAEGRADYCRRYVTKEVAFEPVDGPINDLIDDAYRVKYHSSPYLNPMIGARARSATIKIIPGK